MFYEETCRYLFIRQPFVIHATFRDTVAYFLRAEIELTSDDLLDDGKYVHSVPEIFVNSNLDYSVA